MKDRHTDRQSEEDKIEDRTDIRSEGKDKILYLFDTYYRTGKDKMKNKNNNRPV